MMTTEQRRERQVARIQHAHRMSQIYAEAQKVVATGKCPDCGAPLQRNLSMNGWWQCAAYPSLSMRKAAFKDLPKCDFQCFTE